jgi:Rrf2 family protein
LLFTTKTEYGLKSLVKLAKNRSSAPLPLSSIAKEEKLSKIYLEQLFKKLHDRGIVKSTKGAGGGYVLARPANKISLLEIIESLEGSLAVSYCFGDKAELACSCRGCLTKKVWDKVQKNLILTLKSFKLSDLV